jgi:hypothetical protein
MKDNLTGESKCALCLEWGYFKDVCDSCRDDARLGKSVRKMPKASLLWRTTDKWLVLGDMAYEAKPTPEAALMAAGMMKGGEP